MFFRCCSKLHDVMQLKSAERLFLLLSRAPAMALPSNPVKAVSVIQQSIVGNPDVWDCTLSTWAALQSELGAPSGRGKKRKREEAEREEETNTIREADRGAGQNQPTFRVSCRCSGVIARQFNSQSLNRIIGTAIARELKWKANLRDPALEVNVYLSDDHSVIGIPLLRHPLASRNYLKHTGIRSTVAWALASLCKIQESSVILDPMCGVGTILLEAAQECMNSVFIGMDNKDDQLQKAEENVEAAGQEGRIILIQSSCMEIPLPPASVDGVVCDVPFGRKFSCSTDMATALPQILTEMERVLRPGGNLVLLLSLQLSAQIKRLIKSDTLDASSCNSSHSEAAQTGSFETSEPKRSCSTETLKFGSLVLQSKHRVSLGSTDALIHTYTKIHGRICEHN